MADNERILKQLEKLLELARNNFSDDRFEKVEKLFDHFAERMVTTPASQKSFYHCCYPGGWLDHTHNVISGIVEASTAFKKLGGEIDFTKEEAIFSAMFHDLGKLGDMDAPYYIPQDSDWHRKRGELYKENPALPRMPHAERSLYILQHFGIEMTQKEWHAIRAHDGLYVEGNMYYFRSYGYPPPEFFTNLKHVLHWADMMATVAEGDRYRKWKGSDDT